MKYILKFAVSVFIIRILLSILIKQRGICLRMYNLFVCLSEMAGHALYGMAPCFGHTGVTFDAENDRPVPGSLRGHFEAAQGRF